MHFTGHGGNYRRGRTHEETTRVPSPLDSAPSVCHGWQWTGLRPVPQSRRRQLSRRFRRNDLQESLSRESPKLFGSTDPATDGLRSSTKDRTEFSKAAT